MILRELILKSKTRSQESSSQKDCFENKQLGPQPTEFTAWVGGPCWPTPAPRGAAYPGRSKVHRELRQGPTESTQAADFLDTRSIGSVRKHRQDVVKIPRVCLVSRDRSKSEDDPQDHGTCSLV